MDEESHGVRSIKAVVQKDNTMLLLIHSRGLV
jgi:hypothetical protein